VCVGGVYVYMVLKLHKSRSGNETVNYISRWVVNESERNSAVERRSSRNLLQETQQGGLELMAHLSILAVCQTHSLLPCPTA